MTSSSSSSSTSLMFRLKKIKPNKLFAFSPLPKLTVSPAPRVYVPESYRTSRYRKRDRCSLVFIPSRQEDNGLSKLKMKPV